MKVLVTGGAGFIGSNFLRHMVKKYSSWHFTNLDALTYAGDLKNLEDIQDCANYSFICGSICDDYLVDSILADKADIIINFAAESHVDRSIEDAGCFVETNIRGAFILLEAARKYGTGKFIQISTDEVYGSLGKTGTFTEESPLRANNPYAASKAGADLLALSYYKTFGLPVTITRCSNNFGPSQHPEKMIPRMITNALQNRPLPVYGDGMQVRDWIYVADHCYAIELIVQKGEAGGVYNIGASQEYKNIDLVREILKLVNKPDSLIEFVADRPGHDRRYAIDAGKLRSRLGWQPQFAFKESLRATVKWYEQNKNYWLKEE